MVGANQITAISWKGLIPQSLSGLACKAKQDRLIYINDDFSKPDKVGEPDEDPVLLSVRSLLDPQEKRNDGHLSKPNDLSKDHLPIPAPL